VIHRYLLGELGAVWGRSTSNKSRRWINIKKSQKGRGERYLKTSLVCIFFILLSSKYQGALHDERCTILDLTVQRSGESAEIESRSTYLGLAPIRRGHAPIMHSESRQPQSEELRTTRDWSLDRLPSPPPRLPICSEQLSQGPPLHHRLLGL
jgi:hypothetical protein